MLFKLISNNRQNLILSFIFLLVAVTTACTPGTHSGNGVNGVATLEADTLLNSERIKQIFGSYGVEVLYSDPTTRITSLHSSEGESNITRTFAVVLYPDVVDTALAVEHDIILKGGSIGQVFRDAGWSISKRPIYIGTMASSDKYDRVYNMMGGIDSTDLATYIYTFIVEKDGVNFQYAIIAEFYHPEYLTEADALNIYPEPDHNSTSVQDLDLILGKVKQFMALELVPEPLNQ